MLAGRPPFHGETAVSVAMQHLQSEPAPLSGIREDLPKPVCEMVHRMMAKDPQQRYASAADVLTDVKALLRAAKAGDVDKVQLSKLAGPVVDSSFEVKHPIWALTLLCLLVACASAGIGWAVRSGDPLATPVPPDEFVARAASARDQYLQAMLAGSEQEFLAVKEFWPQDDEWVNRAEEQLTLIYLKDPARRAEADDQIDKLKILGNYDSRFQLEGRVAEAWLLAQGDDADRARVSAILSQLRASEDQLNDTWRNLMQEAEDMQERGGGTQQPQFGQQTDDQPSAADNGAASEAETPETEAPMF
jgi:serine/threonine-protein kinase